ncbi:MAG: hypothetical protein CL955_08805 [Erythrobacteraceae bacterium]|nr:hypothetical protein [Erythrobacteraceae bacterium]
MVANNEASVEEILESIKKVMERDSRASAAQARKRKVEDAERAEARAADTAEDQEDEVLDLAEMELSEIVEFDSEDDYVEDYDANSDDDCENTDDSDVPLIGEAVRGAMQENLAALAMLAEPPAKPQIVRSGETSLEGLTRELLRPMLAEWLDKNLPGMVEKMVQAEIARIAGKRG